MEAENYMKEYFKNYRCSNEYGHYEDGCMLLAAKQLYEVSEDDVYFSFMRNYMDTFLSEEGGIRNGSPDAFTADWVHGSRSLFLLYDTTGEEKYRKALDTVMNFLRVYPRCECGNFVYRREQPEEVSVDALYRMQPFYMEYETVYDKKEKYNDIISQFENVWKTVCTQKELQTGDTARYLTALVDTMDNMSIEIYEQYRKLQDMFKQTLKDVLAYRSQENGLFHKTTEAGGREDKGIDVFGSAIIGYCVLRACRMGVLLKEKYVDTGIEIIERLAARIKSSEGMACSTEEICAFIMAYGQYQQVKRELETIRI